MKRLAASLLISLLIAGLAIAVKFTGLGVVEEISLGSFDLFQRLSPRPPPETPALVVDIDEASLKALGQWPWPRTLLGALTDKLTEAGAAVIGFDLIFPEPDRTSPRHLLAPLFPDETPPLAVSRALAGMPDHDQVFATAIAGSRVVIGSVPGDSAGIEHPLRKAGYSQAGDDPWRLAPRFSRAVTSLAMFEEAAAGIGSLDEDVDWDGLIRRMRLVELVDGAPYPTFPAEVLRVALGAKGYLGRSVNASGEGGGAAGRLVAIRIGPLAVPTDERGRIWIAYRPLDPGRWVSAADAIAGKLDPTAIKDRVVLIGSSAAGLNDLRATPVGPTVPGVEVHAQVIDQAAQRWFLTRPDWANGAERSFIALAALVLAVILPLLGAVRAGLVGALALALCWGLSLWSYQARHWLIDPAYPSLATILVYGGSTVLGYLQAERSRREIKHAFSRYMSPALVDELAAHPERLKLGGEMREMTILFADIRGFTGIAEGLNAQQVTTFINGFLDPMTEVVMAHKGTVDKYIGDCIMVFWNAPLPDPDHARHAVDAALAMRRRLAALNETWRRAAEAAGHPFRPVRIGIGLNTGQCCVGNMGSHQRMEYSVLGDPVNLASRLEGASKTYGVDLVISETTAAALGELPVIELDHIRVKGKTQVVRIFTLLEAPADASAEERAAMLARHRGIRAAYLRRDWKAALDLIDSARRSGEYGLAALYGLYRERIAEFAAEQPPANWDGVHVAHEK